MNRRTIVPCGFFSEGASMMVVCRPLAFAAALCLIAAGGVATAQTVVVTNAPPGSTIELVLNEETIGAEKADPGGQAKLDVNLAGHGGKTETDARLYVDACGGLWRVVVVERGLQPAPPQGTCTRTDLIDLFLLRQVTSLVVDVKETPPAAWVRQGPVPSVWLRQGADEIATARTVVVLPKGLVLFGGGGFTKVRDAIEAACGSVSECTGDNFRLAYSGGAEFWITRYLSAEATYLRPAEITTTGEGGYFRFNNTFSTHIFTFAGKAGIPVGPVRIYGKGGASYHRSTSTTVQTIDDRTGIVDDVPVTLEGGSQVFELETSGWGWMFGGGLEGWVGPSLALYGEAGLTTLKGENRKVGEGQINDRVTFILVGIRVHIGR